LRFLEPEVEVRRGDLKLEKSSSSISASFLREEEVENPPLLVVEVVRVLLSGTVSKGVARDPDIP
jgi:hypothetical protein